MVHGLEETISSATEYKWATTKDEIITEVGKEMSTLRTEMNTLRTEFVTKELFEERMKTLKVDLEGKIERVSIKLNFLIILMIIALTLMNPVVAEIVKGLLKI